MYDSHNTAPAALESRLVEPLPPERPGRRWTWLDLVLVTVSGLLLGLAAVVAFALIARLTGTPLPASALVLLVSAGLYGALTLMAWLLVVQRRGVGWTGIGFRRTSVTAVLWMVPLLAVMLSVNAAVTVLVTRAVGNVQNPQVNALAPGGTMSLRDLLLLLLAASVIAPIVEEMLFRGLLYRYLRARMGVVGSVALSAGLFAALHAVPVLLPMLLVIGVTLALVAERYDSIVPCIALHALHNSLMLVVLYREL